jgi:hypothetical protein
MVSGWSGVFDMNSRIVLAVGAELRPDWVKYVPPVKMGNLTDQKKREAKLVEWEKEARDVALDSPLASTTADFKMLVYSFDDVGVCTNQSTPTEIDGTGAQTLYTRLAENLQGNYLVMGVGVKTAMKRLQFEGLHGNPLFRLPPKLWVFSPTDEADCVLDPVKMFVSGMTNVISTEAVLEYYGIPAGPLDLSAQLRVSATLCTYAGIL